MSECEMAISSGPSFSWRLRRIADRCWYAIQGALFRASMWMLPEDNYIRFARREFIAAGYDPSEKDGPNRWIQDNVLDMLRVMGMQGHSGSSAPFLSGYFNKLSRFEPLTPLTGDDSEWYQPMDGTWQNMRLSSVFKDGDGKAYRYDGRVFREPNGCCYTNGNSRVFIEFPYTPAQEYVDVPESTD
jgi:hypothetical protein